MTTTSKQKTVLAIVIAVLGAVPALFSYLQATQETRAKYRQSHSETEKSYEALAASVKDLQQAMLVQHDYVVKLEGQVAVLTSIIAHQPVPTSTASGLRLSSPPSLPKLERPPARPELPAPPDFEVVQMKR